MKNMSDVIGGLFLFLVSLGAMIGGVRLRVGTPTDPQPGFFPFVGGLVVMIFSAIILIQGWLGRTKRKTAFGELGRPALLLGVLVLLVGILDRVGYVIGTLVASGLILRILGVKSWRVLIITSLSLSIGTYILFDKLLGVELPVGFLARFGL